MFFLAKEICFIFSNVSGNYNFALPCFFDSFQWLTNVYERLIQSNIRLLMNNVYHDSLA